MTTLRERAARLLLGPELKELETLGAVATRLVEAYQEGPYELPPQELIRQLQEYDSAMVLDLVDQLKWQAIGDYGGYSEDERKRSVEDSKRMWKYSIIAQWIVSLWTFYGMGETVAITLDDEAAQKAWSEFWKADRNMPLLAPDDLHEISWWLLVKGERFLAFYISELDGEATVRTIQPEQITGLVTAPGDAVDVLYYKREWTEANGKRHCVYYPDWQAFFDDRLSEAELPDGARRAEDEKPRTAVCMLFVPFRQLDEDSLRGWPLLAPAGTPWIRGQREFYENRLAVSRAKAAYVRRRTVKGGSRAVDAVRSRLMSALTTGQSETNPVPTAGSEDIHNEAIKTEELPMATGAGDAKTDGEMFSWMAGLAGGVFPHYMGLGDAYRLACYSEDTQVLTENGWKLWHEWQPEERIATYNQATRALEYRTPTRLHVYEYQGTMVRIHSTAVDALVTPEHRMLVRRESDMADPDPTVGYTVQQAGELKKRFVLPARAFLEDRPDIETFTLPGHVYHCGNHHSRKEVPAVELPMDDWLEFLGWWLSEGDLHKSSGQVEVSQSVSSPHFGGLEGLFARLAASGLGFFQRVSHDGTYSTWGKTSKALYMWLEQNCGGEVFSKHLPAFALKLNQRQTRILLDALWKGDGHLATDKQQYIGCYTSVSERLADEVQILQMHLGDWGRTRLLHEESHGVYHRLPIYRTHRRTCDVGFCLRREKHVEWVDYDGVVWCFEAPPNKMFITRRNGQPLIAGNTASAMEKPLEMQFSLYRKRLSALFQRMVHIVIEAKRKYGKLTVVEGYKITISLDRMVEVDVTELTEALSRVWRDVVGQVGIAGGAVPDQVLQNMLVFSLQQALGAMGATNAEEMVNAEMWAAEPEAEPVDAAETHLHESHAGELVDATCPLCAWPRAVLYPDHGGLLVCEGCEKTFDPTVE